MVWQKVDGHIHDERIHVKSKDGNVYPADCSRQDAKHVYQHGVNDNSWDLWAWVEFGDGTPFVEYVCTGHPSGGPPKSPPWEL